MISTAYALGLIGYPLGHSLSPQIHAAALHALRISGEYSLYPVSPSTEGQQELAGLLERVRDGKFHGLNVTIPHKQNVIPLLDELTPAAQAIGAVNTIFMQADKLVGDNTDAPGFWGDLKRLTVSHPFDDAQDRPFDEAQDKQRSADSAPRTPGSALVLGAGGSARAVVYALLTHDYQVTIAARRLEQAEELCDRFSAAAGSPSALELSPSAISNLQSPISLLVNTTPVGMYPHGEASPWPAEIPLPPNAAVYDLVYNPRETLLVRRAREIGLPATTGLGMLVEQAALAFERWTGVEAPRAVMMEAAER